MSPVQYVCERHILYSSSPLGSVAFKDLFLQLRDGRGLKGEGIIGPVWSCRLLYLVSEPKVACGLPSFTSTSPSPRFLQLPLGRAPTIFSQIFNQVLHPGPNWLSSVSDTGLSVCLDSFIHPKPNRKKPHQPETWHFCHRLYVMFVQLWQVFVAACGVSSCGMWDLVP